jgi:hypothetical protein
MGQILHFYSFCSSRYVETQEEDWGMTSENGKLFGMIGMVARNEVDVAVGGLALYHTRLDFVEFLVPLLTDKYVQT